MTRTLSAYISTAANRRSARPRSGTEDCARVSRTTFSAAARCVFVRRYWYFDKAPDIARRYSFGESKVKFLLSRRRNRLKKFLIMEGHNI